MMIINLRIVVAYKTSYDIWTNYLLVKFLLHNSVGLWELQFQANFIEVSDCCANIKIWAILEYFLQIHIHNIRI